MEAFTGVQLQQFTSWSYIMIHTLFSWSQMVERLKSNVSVCVRVIKRECMMMTVCVCVWKVSFFFLMLDRWKAKKQYWPYMTIFSSHFSLPSPSPSLFSPHWYLTCTALNLLITFHIFFSNLLRRLAYVTHRVCDNKICIWSLMVKRIELALVKNTERWVSLPRIQIGNFGDLRNAPTWNTQKKECVTNERLFSVIFECLTVVFFLQYI